MPGNTPPPRGAVSELAAPPAWHCSTVEEVALELATRLPGGLDRAEAAARLARLGPNLLVEGRRRGPGRILLEQFTDLMVLVLIGAAVVAGLVGEPQDTVAILAIVVLNATLGFIQEYRAERAVAALKAMTAPHARVRREGTVEVIPAADLVPGDVVLLEAGNIVPADLRLIEAADLRIEEAALTGESHPVEKTTAALPDAGLPIGDRRNLAYKGTMVAHGRAVGIVVGTGMRTELGRIATLLHEEAELKTPLQRRLARFARLLAFVVLALCATIFGVGLLRGEEPVLMFLTALSLAVAAMPEALPAVVTVSLALGARRMMARRALVRRLPAVETLGSVTVICSDKTGTLTQNRMQVGAVRGVAEQPGDDAGAAPSGRAAELLDMAMGLSHDAERAADGALHGDPTETALLRAAEAAGLVKSDLEARWPRVAEIPFSSERGRMTTLHRDGTEILVFTKGAPEQVLPLCTGRLSGGRVLPPDDAAVTRAVESMAGRGLRVLAVATRRLGGLPARPTADSVEADLTLIALVGLRDPPRPEAEEAIRLCVSAGITVVMITGDHPVTARAIARELGILRDDEGRVLSGTELARLSFEELAAAVEDVRVYARAAPEQKITIVKALQARGEFVAMTGDGVNDAPALRRADIGVAMGRAGTDVAREAAHMVLLDDNFTTIVAAVREGRRIFDNIRKFIRYILACNSAEIWALFLAPFLGLPVPLLPIHILWINLATDGLPGVALAVEPEERGLMDRPPRPPSESIFAHGLWQHVVWVGLLMSGVTLLTQAWAYRTGFAHWQSMTFTVLALSQLGHVLAIRSERSSVLGPDFASNLPLLGAVLLTIGLQLATLYVPLLNRIFKTEPLSAGELGLCLGLSTVVFFAVEAEKWLTRRGLIFREGAVR
jgi:P-type Ca2+ transporter type 2C